MRISRTGFLQRRVLGALGIYPWKCGACGSVFLCANRGGRERRESRSQKHRPVELESHQT